MSELVGVSPRDVVVAQRLKSQWAELVSIVGGSAGLIESEFAALVQMYQLGDGRSYHNLLHIGKVDEMLNRYRSLARNFVALKFAGDGHDVVYVPGSETNETDSGVYMRGAMSRLGIPVAIIDETERIIVITKDHKTTADDIDGKLMIDADFAIFASPQEEYDTYARGIWQEYVGSGRVSEDRFKMGRSALIKDWLAQDRIFLVDDIRRDLEPVARRNLEKELTRLAA